MKGLSIYINMIEWAEKENIGPKMEKAKEKIVSAKNSERVSKGHAFERTWISCLESDVIEGLSWTWITFIYKLKHFQISGFIWASSPALFSFHLLLRSENHSSLLTRHFRSLFSFFIFYLTHMFSSNFKHVIVILIAMLYVWIVLSRSCGDIMLLS